MTRERRLLAALNRVDVALADEQRKAIMYEDKYGPACRASRYEHVERLAKKLRARIAATLKAVYP